MPDTVAISLERIIKRMQAGVRARVFEEWGVCLDEVKVVTAQSREMHFQIVNDIGVRWVEDVPAPNTTNFKEEIVYTNTELIPGVLWGGYSERLNTLVLRTA